MIIPENLTPFSKSFLYPTLTTSWQRAQDKLQITNQPAVPALHIKSRWASLTQAIWGTTPEQTAHLLAIQPVNAPGTGKAARGLKLGTSLLPDFAAVYQRVQSWHTTVVEAEWSQAQLLQVMEEVEPRTIEVLSWLHITAVLAVGSYAHLGQLIARFEKDAARAHSLRLGLTAGLSTPEAALLAALSADATPKQHHPQFGHLPLQENLELAHPRWKEQTIAAAPSARGAWNQERARARRQTASQEVIARTSFLGRSAMKKTIALVQEALVAHAQARDALAYAMSATRHWAHAAADEGLSDSRLLAAEEIYLLEIEEIKQMMTGEWASRERTAPLIAQRQNSAPAAASPEPTGLQALGVAGETATGNLHTLTSSDAGLPSAPFIAHSNTWGPQAWQALLSAQGILDTKGTLLSWSAAAARAGDLAAVVNVAESQLSGPNSQITLFPHQNHIELQK